MNRLRLTAAFGDYDRTGLLGRGMVLPEGIDLRVINLPPGEIFYRMCNYLEFEVSEMSMGAYCHLLGMGDSPFVGMPAFPSRAFRHSIVYYNEDSGIEKPEDLNGKRIAIREWGMTSVLWIVGILSEEYGLDITTVDWIAANKARVPIILPEGVRIHYTSEGKSLSDMLENGEVDAAFLHQVPDCFSTGSPRVKRMFHDYKNIEIEYYRKTSIHPIMHCVVLRRDVFERNPWTLRSIYKAMDEARKHTVKALSDNGAYSAMIPLLPAVMDEMRSIFGVNFWPYGLEANRLTLEKLVQYAYQQGLTDRQLSVDELFGKSVRDS
jgi:4,5-dihydroxyphthalate decarboxylase